MKDLTDKQKLFAHEYLIDLNATKAAIRAGYSKKTADKIGSQLLGKTRVKKAVDLAIKKRSQKLEITADQVLQEIAKSAFSNILDYVTVAKDGAAYVDLTKLTREQAAAISEITVDTFIDKTDVIDRDVKRIRLKLNDKTKSLDQLGKHLKLFTDKVEVGGSLLETLVDMASRPVEDE